MIDGRYVPEETSQVISFVCHWSYSDLRMTFKKVAQQREDEDDQVN